MKQFYLHNSMYTSSAWLNYAIKYKLLFGFSLFLETQPHHKFCGAATWPRGLSWVCCLTCVLLLLKKVFHLLMHALELVSVSNVFELFTFCHDQLKFLFLWTFLDVRESPF